VVTVLVGEDDPVDVVDVVLDGADDARIGAGVDQRRGFALDQVGVAGERLRGVGNGVDLHGRVVGRSPLECGEIV